MFLPTPVWGKLPHLLCQEGLAAVAGVTPCHIAGNIVGDAQPPVIVGDQLQCLPLPWVASHHGVMVGMDNVMAELGVFWDIHVSPVHDQVSISLPLVRSKRACSKLLEGFDYCIVVVCTSPDVFYQLITSAIHQGCLRVMNFKHIRGE